MRSKGKALAATFSDEESVDFESDQEGNFIAFMAIFDETENDNLEPKVESDVILEEDANLQDAYNKMLLILKRMRKLLKLN